MDEQCFFKRGLAFINCVSLVSESLPLELGLVWIGATAARDNSGGGGGFIWCIWVAW